MSPFAGRSGRGCSWGRRSGRGGLQPRPDPDKFAGHSLRAGFATTAASKGKSIVKIMRHGRWRDQRTAMSYIRPATLWDDNAAEGLGDDDVGVEDRDE